MKTFISTLMALMLASMLAMPVHAGGNTQATTVAKTFTLTLHGSVPADQVFYVRYMTQQELEAGGGPKVIQICGDVPASGANRVDRVISNQACVGNGASYTAQVELPQVSRLAHQYFTVRASDPQGTYRVVASNFQGERPDGPEDFETLTGNTTTSAEYRLGSTPPVPSQMPDTGARGMGSARLPLVAGAAILLLLGAGGYASRKGRQAQA